MNEKPVPLVLRLCLDSLTPYVVTEHRCVCWEWKRHDSPHTCVCGETWGHTTGVIPVARVREGLACRYGCCEETED